MLYLDEEMRKQIEVICDAIAWTACERPEGMSKAFRDDLFKKLASADAVFGRLPYQIITRVIHMVGWKRMELNRLIKFAHVSEATFQSIFRRCLLIKIKARFVDAQYIADKLPDASKYGLFVRDPDMKEFLGGSQAIAAGLILQHAFEAEYNLVGCRKKIEDYRVHGGDHGLTEREMRIACELPPAPPLTTGEDGLPVGIVLTPETPGESETKVDVSTLRQDTIKSMLDRGLDYITRAYFNLVPISDRSNYRSREASWKTLDQSPLWGKMTNQKGSESFYPILKSNKKYEDIITGLPGVWDKLTESHEVSALWLFANGHKNRHDNMVTMIEALQGCNRGTKGRASELVQRFKEHAQSLKDIEAKMEKYLQTAPRARNESDCPSQNRRVRRKVSESSIPPTVRDDAIQTSYNYKNTPARAFASARGLQHLTRRMQKVLAPLTHDLDIKQAMNDLSYQLVEKLDLVDKDLFATEIALLGALASNRDQFARDELQMEPNEGKDAILKTLGGSTEWKGIGFEKLQRASRFLRWVAASCLPDEFTLITQNKDKWALASTFAVWWQRAEDLVLRAWVLFIQEQPTTHLSLHFDGVRVDPNRIQHEGDVDEFCENRWRKFPLRLDSFLESWKRNILLSSN